VPAGKGPNARTLPPQISGVILGYLACRATSEQLSFAASPVRPPAPIPTTGNSTSSPYATAGAWEQTHPLRLSSIASNRESQMTAAKA
jgi:hypothetical protein